MILHGKLRFFVGSEIMAIDLLVELEGNHSFFKENAKASCIMVAASEDRLNEDTIVTRKGTTGKASISNFAFTRYCLTEETKNQCCYMELLNCSFLI